MYNQITQTAAGSSTVVNLTFEFLDRSHVKALVEGVDAAFTWTGESQITIPTTSGDEVIVYRDTPITTPLVDYVDASVLTAAELDLADTQLRYHQEEVDQRVMSVPDVTGVAADAEAASDAAGAAVTSAAGSATSASAASTSATAAAASATAAAGSAADAQEVVDGALEAFSDYSTATIGRVTTASGVAASDITMIFDDPVDKDGQVTAIRADFQGAGTLKVRAGTRSGTTITPKGPTVTLTAAAGANEWAAPADFTALDVVEGDVIIFYGTTALSTIAGAGSNIYFAGGDQVAAASYTGAFFDSTVVQAGFDIESLAYTKVRAITQAAYDALDPKSSTTLYVII